MAEAELQKKIVVPILTGTEFMKRVRDNKMTRMQYEAAVFAAVTAGNVPDFVKKQNFTTISIPGKLNGRDVEVKVRVSLDYVAIGTNEDYVRVPLSPLIGQKIARYYGCVLPTKTIVDAIDSESRKRSKLTHALPSKGGNVRFYDAPKIADEVEDPQNPGHLLSERLFLDTPSSNEKITKIKSARLKKETQEEARKRKFDEDTFRLSYLFFETQSRMTDDYLEERGYVVNGSNHTGSNHPFVSGNKKDPIYYGLVISGRLAFYHFPFQPMDIGKWHEDTYADYSHGIRLVDEDVIIVDKLTGKETKTTIQNIISDPTLCHLLTVDSPIDFSKMYSRPLRFGESY